jgi:hypothetical protein
MATPAQRTAVKQRPHQETTSLQAVMTEPVVPDHGREGRRIKSRRGAAVSFNSLLGGDPQHAAVDDVELASRSLTLVVIWDGSSAQP